MRCCAGCGSAANKVAEVPTGDTTLAAAVVRAASVLIDVRKQPHLFEICGVSAECSWLHQGGVLDRKLCGLDNPGKILRDAISNMEMVTAAALWPGSASLVRDDQICKSTYARLKGSQPTSVAFVTSHRFDCLYLTIRQA
jgi:hypothetical protein